MKVFALSILLLLFSINSLEAQIEYGKIEGIVLDSNTNEAVPFAYVAVLINNQVIHDTYTDVNGNYSFDYLISGTYKLKISTVGYLSNFIEGITVKMALTKKLTNTLSLNRRFTCCCSDSYTEPSSEIDNNIVIEIDNTTTGRVLGQEEIQHLPF